MPNKTRREFLKTTAATGIGFWVAGGLRAQESRSPNERIAMAAVGVGGKGTSDAADAAARGDMVAICDADTSRLEGAGKRYDKAKQYADFRKMLDEMGKSIDAITVSTPDHTHTAPAAMAMRMGIHCFLQKPLTRTIYEARLLGNIAREKKLSTQMGNQGTASGALREAAAMLRAGVLGKVSEVHVWTNRPIWPQGGERPAPQDPPPHLDWDSWIGPAPMRPYGPGYHPFSWRGWWDFGTGALGDMACHTLNMPFMGLDLRDPVSVQAETPGHNKDSFPRWSVIEYQFPANDWRGALKMVWYDGGKRPEQDLLGGEKMESSGALVIGEKGKMYSPGDYGGGRLIGVDRIEVDYPKSPGHFEEWTRAIRGGDPAMSNFPDYASPLTETVLLGNLAVWVASEPGMGQKVEWDAKSLRVKNISGLETMVKPVYRAGYVLE
jgi:predicted dehydrogenase